jgi:UDP-N-acetylmuramoylalanine--D-glutamate ligase
MSALEAFKTYIAGKRVTVMGLGLLGRGVGDVAFLSQCGAIVTVTDMKSEEKLVGSIDQLRGFEHISFHLGGHREEDFTNTDMVIKAAGVRMDSPYIAAARAAGVAVFMSTALFAQYARAAGARIVGVTGTRGKSTVSHMIYHALKHVGKRTMLGGNVRGLSTLSMLPDVHEGDIAVLELDSWQLQGFGERSMSPHVAVFTNLMPDHQNYYPDMDTYFADKAQIFLHQTDGDVLFAGRDIEPRIRAAHPAIEPVVPGMIPPDWELRIPGAHNRENAAFAAAALFALGLNTEQIRAGIESFEGVEGRLQYLGITKQGVRVYNDNNATTPAASLAALHALDQGRRDIVLIAGGSDKGLDIAPWADCIQRVCKASFLVAGSGTDRLKSILSEAPVFFTFETAVDSAFDTAVFGDVVLLSPGFASFGTFENEYDRNDQFLALVKKHME